jgi:hypothetical protein
LTPVIAVIAVDVTFFFIVISREKWERMMQTNGWNSVELRDNRYNQIIHMVSAANGAEDFYTTEVCVMSWNWSCYIIKWCKTVRLVSKSASNIMLSYYAQVLANTHFSFS